MQVDEQQDWAEEVCKVSQLCGVNSFKLESRTYNRIKLVLVSWTVLMRTTPALRRTCNVVLFKDVSAAGSDPARAV